MSRSLVTASQIACFSTCPSELWTNACERRNMATSAASRRSRNFSGQPQELQLQTRAASPGIVEYWEMERYCRPLAASCAERFRSSLAQETDAQRARRRDV